MCFLLGGIILYKKYRKALFGAKKLCPLLEVSLYINMLLRFNVAACMYTLIYSEGEEPRDIC